MTHETSLELAKSLLERAANSFEESVPDATWFLDYFLFTGDHMILTEEGWQYGELKAELVEEYGEDHILGEVNTPAVV